MARTQKSEDGVKRRSDRTKTKRWKRHDAKNGVGVERRLPLKDRWRPRREEEEKKGRGGGERKPSAVITAGCFRARE